MTNREKVNQMTDEELVWFIVKCLVMHKMCADRDCHDHTNGFAVWLEEWLKQEAEEDEE